MSSQCVVGRPYLGQSRNVDPAGMTVLKGQQAGLYSPGFLIGLSGLRHGEGAYQKIMRRIQDEVSVNDCDIGPVFRPPPPCAPF
jgi:hypothetical protein